MFLLSFSLGVALYLFANCFHSNYSALPLLRATEIIKYDYMPVYNIRPTHGQISPF